MATTTQITAINSVISAGPTAATIAAAAAAAVDYKGMCGLLRETLLEAKRISAILVAVTDAADTSKQQLANINASFV